MAACDFILWLKREVAEVLVHGYVQIELVKPEEDRNVRSY
jgi:hypothetical protein